MKINTLFDFTKKRIYEKKKQNTLRKRSEKGKLRNDKAETDAEIILSGKLKSTENHQLFIA